MSPELTFILTLALRMAVTAAFVVSASVITDADTTNAAVMAMRNASVRMKMRSGDTMIVVILRDRQAIGPSS